MRLAYIYSESHLEDVDPYEVYFLTSIPFPSQVGWLRAEDQTVLTMHERAVLGSRYSVGLDAPQTWQLRIRPLKAEDRGCYMCQINTQPSMKWQIGCIDVYGK